MQNIWKALTGRMRRWLIRLGILPNDEGVFYIGGTVVLPPPLCRDEEKEAIEGCQTGDAACRDRLIEHNLRLVVYIAKKFENTGISMEDLISIGTIGLIKAVETFNTEKKTKLATYASRCIENEILMHIRKISNQKAEISLDEPINQDGDGNELLLSDILGTGEDEIFAPLEAAADLTALRQALGELPGRERELIGMRYGLDGQKELTQKEIAQKLGISQSYISRLEKKILGKLRREFQRQMSCA